MRKLVLLCFFIVLFFSIPSGTILAEQIDTFSATYLVQTDGTVQVIEEITYNFGSLDRHGIFRFIPKTKINQDRKKYILSYVGISITDKKGKPYFFTSSNSNDTLTIKIGDPDRTITGMHDYILRYKVSGAVTYFSDHDELNWNVTGNEWNVPIQNAQAIVTLPVPVDTKKLQQACFTGSLGGTSSDCSTSLRDQSVQVISEPLENNQGLTFVIGFPKGIVANLEPTPYVTFFETLVGKITLVLLAIAAIFWYIVTPGLIIYRWSKYGRDPKPAMGVTTAWFDAPKTKNLRRLTPGETGTLVDEQADLSDITATIVDLARRGYLRIIETKKNDFSLEKKNLDNQKETLEAHEQTLLSGIFKDNELVRIKDTDLIQIVENAKKDIYKSVVSEGFFSKNPQTTRTLFGILAVFALVTGNFFLAIVSYFFGRAMPRKTLYGAEQAAVALSLKNFLSSQEKKLAFQAKNQMFFEKLLPYAVAFGVERIWAQRFKDIQMTPPDWYQPYGNNFLSSYAFAHTFGSGFSRSFSSSATYRSSSGFSSGFSGGSSGGGGGGGGGGSW